MSESESLRDIRPGMTLEQAQAQVETKTAPRVTKPSIEEKIQQAQYICNGQLTICVLTMQNGFQVVGKSAPASPENFDKHIGERYAYEDAFKQLWALEGYLLCEQLLVLKQYEQAVKAAKAAEKRIITP